jgi:hypothetical protein
LANDRNELINLWDDPESQHRRHELIETVARQMMELADTRTRQPCTMGPKCKNTFQSFKTFQPFKSLSGLILRIEGSPARNALNILNDLNRANPLNELNLSLNPRRDQRRHG